MFQALRVLFIVGVGEVLTNPRRCCEESRQGCGFISPSRVPQRDLDVGPGMNELTWFLMKKTIKLSGCR